MKGIRAEVYPRARFGAVLWVLGCAAVAGGTVGCNASVDGGDKTPDPASAGGSTTVSAGGSGTGAVPQGGGGTSGGSDGMVTQVDTALPPLPELVNVSASIVDDSVNITFDEVDGARDYRVYVLPADSDISSDDSGHITVQNAVYRCAGDRQAPKTVLDSTDWVQGYDIYTLVDGADVIGYTRTMDESTLGYVYTTPGDGRVPVYQLGDSASNADSDCDFMGGMTRWQESRSATYTTSETERTTLLGERWRDDGIAFYVPSAAGAETQSVYVQEETDNSPRLFFIDGAEASMRDSDTVAFPVLKAAADGAVPLRRVFYHNGCGKSHDVLAAGNPAFERARVQGDLIPINEVHWSGFEAETTLVVEALADGCPYDGFMSPKPVAARDIYPEWQTPEALQAASPTGELYINGQHEAGVNPKPISRSFVKVSPANRPEMDWFMDFSTATEADALADADCGTLDGNCWGAHRLISDDLDVTFVAVEDDRREVGQAFGEFWVTYGDVAADVNGKFRITPAQKATMAADSFVHATMMLDTFTTGRRYPQIIISDKDVPVQYHMQEGYALVFQTFGGWPNVFQLEVCDHQYWDVNAQCPAFDSHHILDPNDIESVTGLLPHPEVGEHSGMDRATKLDVYASTERAYWFLDGRPFSCADLPDATVPAGPVTVTFGDVLYHSGVDATFTYTAKALQVSSRRHYDNLGFSSGVPAPEWDESRFPCATHLK
jgi:hypothetical protein